MKKLMIVLGLSFVLFYGHAQVTEAPNGKGQFGLVAGYTYGLIGDQHASPLLYQAHALNLGGVYQHRGAPFIEVSLIVAIGTNQPRKLGQRSAILESTPDIYGQVELDEVSVNPFLSKVAGDLRIKALWPIADRHQLGVSLNARHIYTGIAVDDWHFSQVDLAPEYQFTMPSKDGQLELGFSLPLLSGVVRPNYAFDPSLPDLTNYYQGYLRTSSKITSINELFNPRLSVAYGRTLGNGKDLKLQYSAGWTSYPNPRPVRMFENGFSLFYFL